MESPLLPSDRFPDGPHIYSGYLWYVHLLDKSSIDAWELLRRLKRPKEEIIGHVGPRGEFPQVIGLALVTETPEPPPMPQGLICEPMRLNNRQGRVHQSDDQTWVLDKVMRDEGSRVFSEIWFAHSRDAVEALVQDPPKPSDK